MPEALYIVLAPHGHHHRPAVLKRKSAFLLLRPFLFLFDIKRIIKRRGSLTVEFFPYFFLNRTGTADYPIRSATEKLQKPGISHIHIAADTAPGLSTGSGKHIYQIGCGAEAVCNIDSQILFQCAYPPAPAEYIANLKQLSLRRPHMQVDHMEPPDIISNIPGTENHNINFIKWLQQARSSYADPFKASLMQHRYNKHNFFLH